VVDYKTGDPEKAKPKLQRPSEKEPLAVITGDKLYFIKYYWIITHGKIGKLSVQNLILSNRIKRSLQKRKSSDHPEDIDIVSKQISSCGETFKTVNSISAV
jgi:DNA helicase-2/ATP-dependent DNA helicase PcrA